MASIKMDSILFFFAPILALIVNVTTAWKEVNGVKSEGMKMWIWANISSSSVGSVGHSWSNALNTGHCVFGGSAAQTSYSSSNTVTMDIYFHLKEQKWKWPGLLSKLMTQGFKQTPNYYGKFSPCTHVEHGRVFLICHTFAVVLESILDWSSFGLLM